jgi:hypothetical protein
MAKRLTDEQYEKLRDAFTVDPNCARAALIAGVNAETAKRAYLRGIPNRGKPPIVTLVRDAQIRARSILEADRSAARARDQKERTDAAAHAVATKVAEGQLTDLARVSSLQAMAVVRELSVTSRTFLDVMKARAAIEVAKVDAWNDHERQVMALAPGAPPLPAPGFARPPMTLDAIVLLLNRAADYAVKINTCMRQSLESTRLYLGEPTDILKVIEEQREVTVEELEIRRDAAVAAINAGLREGGLRVLPGGKQEAEPGAGRRVVPPPVVGKSS